MKPRPSNAATASKLTAILTGRHARFAAEYLGEVAWAGEAQIEGDLDDALFAFAQPPSRLIHARIKLIFGRGSTGRLPEETVKVEFAQAGHLSELVQVEFGIEVGLDPISDLLQLVAR